jgi:hypothetical protein
MWMFLGLVSNEFVLIGRYTYWIITFLEPFAIRRPLPRMTPAEPMPMRDLLGATSIALIPALSKVTWIEVAPAPALPFVHLLLNQ